MLRISQPDRLAGQRGTWWGADHGMGPYKIPMVETSGMFGLFMSHWNRGNFGYLRDWNFGSALLFLGAVQIKVYTQIFNFGHVYGSFKPTLFFFIRCNTHRLVMDASFLHRSVDEALADVMEGTRTLGGQMFSWIIYSIMISRTSDLMMWWIVDSIGTLGATLAVKV